jgi:hypothetical protein
MSTPEAQRGSDFYFPLFALETTRTLYRQIESVTLLADPQFTVIRDNVALLDANRPPEQFWRRKGV